MEELQEPRTYSGGCMVMPKSSMQDWFLSSQATIWPSCFCSPAGREAAKEEQKKKVFSRENANKDENGEERG